MKTRTSKKAMLFAAVVTAAVGGTPAAWAQSSDTVGGTTTDMTSAGNENGGNMPQM